MLKLKTEVYVRNQGYKEGHNGVKFVIARHVRGEGYMIKVKGDRLNKGFPCNPRVNKNSWYEKELLNINTNLPAGEIYNGS